MTQSVASEKVGMIAQSDWEMSQYYMGRAHGTESQRVTYPSFAGDPTQ